MVRQHLVRQYVGRRCLELNITVATIPATGTETGEPKARGIQPRAFIAALWLSAVGLAVVLARLPSMDTQEAMPARAVLVAFLFAGAEVFVVHVKLRHNAHTFSFAEIALVVGLFAVEPVIAVIAAIVGSGLSLAIYRGQRQEKLFFNTAKTAIEIELALILFHALVNDTTIASTRVLVSAGASVVVASVIGAALVTTVIALSEREWPRAVFRDLVGFGLVGTFVAVSLGLLSVVLAWAEPWTLALLVAPSAGCFWFYAAFGHERQRTESLQFLYTSTRLLHETQDLDDALVALLIETRSALRARVAELIYRPANVETKLHIRIAEGEAPVVSTTRPSPGAAALCDLAAKSPRARFISIDDGHGRYADTLGTNGYRSALIARLDEGGEIVGAIAIADHLVDVARFRREDIELVDTLAGALSIALENGALERMLHHSRELERKLDHQAHHDALTGLPNRVRFTERIAELTSYRKETGKEFAVLFIDLDDFKTVNDSLGHAAGDQLLTVVAQRLTSCMREDDMVVRLGGDEFAVVLASADRSRPEALADRIHEALQESVALDASLTRISASIGIAHSADLLEPSDVLRSADAAMYHAKASGKQRSVVYRPSMHASMVERYELLNQLDRAIDNEEIVVVFQPLVTLDGCVRGGEALARWNHPERGTIHPEAFIPLAEESHTITRITHLALVGACRAIVNGTMRRASVNISATDLAQPDFGAMVADVLRETGVQPDDITLEITESQVMQHAEALEAFTTLRRVGVRLALDDFGTGYSSLAALREYPISQLKIAKPFIDDLESDPAAVKFVELIVGLGKNLDMEVVAEGIEREAQVEILRSLECHLGQGYFFARPLAPEQFRAAWSEHVNA
jgi:diguanylate cyclase (GGDEF)-like protein